MSTSAHTADAPDHGEDEAVTERVRQAIAQALWVADEGPKRADEWWDAGEYEAVRAACYKRADAVLDCLRRVGSDDPLGSACTVPWCKMPVVVWTEIQATHDTGHVIVTVPFCRDHGPWVGSDV